MGNLVSLADRANDNRFTTPKDMLEQAMRDLEAKELHGGQAILLVLDRGPAGNCYSVGFRAANIRKSEIVALLTVQATAFAKDLTDG